jgi:MoaA/NifB/PqqE/SkfB family radical SAM enzyme
MNDPLSLYSHERYGTIHQAPHLDFPLMLILQASSYCNFTCRQCPRVVKVPRRSATGLGEGFLQPEVVRKAAEEFRGRPAFLGALFALYGEPLMNPRIVELVKIVKDAGKKVQITTNGLLLSEELSRRLMDAGLDKIKFSFQGTTERAYSFWRNTTSYSQVMRNILAFLELREKRSAPVFVQVGTSVAEDSDEDIEAFLSFWKPKVDDVYYDATGMLHLQDQDYVKGKVFRHQGVRRTERCVDIFARMSILHNGQVPLCVDDEEHRMGNLRDQSIAEIWNGPGFQANRRNILSPCRFCYTSPRPPRRPTDTAAHDTR